MKNNTLSFIIPGLSMSSVEFSKQTDCIVLENFEIGTNSKNGKPAYTLEDLAQVHLEEILKQTKKYGANKLRIMGMSMGGMILSCIASTHADKLPKDTEFYFLVTTPNNAQAEAIPDIVVQKWMSVNPENEESLKNILRPFLKSRPAGTPLASVS